MTGCNKLKARVEEWGACFGQNQIVGQDDYGFNAEGRVSG
jgi:hypothetical protein